MQPPAQNPTRLLLVEDSLATRKLLASLINGGSEPYSLFEAGTAEEALDILGPDNPRGIDVCFVDLHLPGMDGADLVREIRRRFGPASSHRPYVVVVTSDEMDTTINRCIEAGANDYITKPVNLKVLQIRLRVARLLCRAGAPAAPPDATDTAAPRKDDTQGRAQARSRSPEKP